MELLLTEQKLKQDLDKTDRNYLLGRERKFLADLAEIDRVLKGEK